MSKYEMSRCHECDQRPEDGCMFGCQTARAVEAERKLEEAREVLRSVEWSSVVWSGETAWTACPSCERIDPSRTRGMPESLRPLVGHAPDCRLAKVLGEEHG